MRFRADMDEFPKTADGYPELLRVKCERIKFLRQDGRWRAIKCGHCIPCGDRYRMDWANRINEEMAHQAQRDLGTVFATLTFNNDGLAEHGTRPNVRELQLFNKRFREDYARTYGVRGLKYVLVSEYGDRNRRLHYHVIYFGVNEDHAEQLIRKHWRFGFVDVRQVDKDGGYLMKYVRKQPGLFLMSRRPGIGAAYAEHLAADPSTKQSIATTGDTPALLEKGKPGKKQKIPLARYWRTKMRQAHGLEDRIHDPIALAGDAWQCEEVTRQMARYEGLTAEHQKTMTAQAITDHEAVRRSVYYSKNPRTTAGLQAAYARRERKA